MRGSASAAEAAVNQLAYILTIPTRCWAAYRSIARYWIVRSSVNFLSSTLENVGPAAGVFVLLGALNSLRQSPHLKTTIMPGVPDFSKISGGIGILGKCFCRWAPIPNKKSRRSRLDFAEARRPFLEKVELPPIGRAPLAQHWSGRPYQAGPGLGMGRGKCEGGRGGGEGGGPGIYSNWRAEVADSCLTPGAGYEPLLVRQKAGPAPAIPTSIPPLRAPPWGDQRWMPLISARCPIHSLHIRKAAGSGPAPKAPSRATL